MEYLFDFLNNKVIFVPIVAWIIAQVMKVIIHALVEKELRIERLFGDGGMPSAHSATVVSLVVMCGWGAGFDSGLFALATIFAIVVMHDATGVRREAGKHAQKIIEIADIINGMFAGETEEVRTAKLKEFIGHTPIQVTMGGILGGVVGILAIIIGKLPYCFGVLPV